jgi:uncharacterized protein YndB with AHSA1/START domain
MGFFKGLVITISVIVGLVVGGALFLPESAHIERTTRIEASPAQLYALTSGYARFNEWSPWAGLDPATKYTYEGPATGVGAKMSWSSGMRQVGAGKQEIVAVEPDKLVRTALEFGEGGPATAEMRFVPDGTGTQVTWTLDSTMSPLPFRWLGLFLDKIVGPDYERGLAQLKALAERDAAAAPTQAAETPATPTGQETPVPPNPQ